MSNKIGFFTIATNDYIKYAINLAKSLDAYAKFNSLDVELVIFSNKKDIDIKTNNIKIKYVHVSHVPFPMISIFRYEYYLAYENIEEYDYIYHIDCDMKLVSNVGEEILSKRVCVKHPGMFVAFKAPNDFPYERNPKSTAYIPEGSGSSYFQNCFQGGEKVEFINMCKVIQKYTETDLKRNYIPFAHDESYMNKYMIDNPPTLELPPTYAQPQLWRPFGDVKIIHICKDKPPHDYYNNI